MYNRPKTHFRASVIINSFRRPKKIKDCLKTLLKSSFQDFEIIVVEQKGGGELKQWIRTLNNSKIRYFNLKKAGAARAKNFGIKKAREKIIAFTDDDCVTDRNWLREIYKSFQKNKEIVGVFGEVSPYQPEKHKGLICPCTFEKEKERIVSKPCRHWQEIGFGNNMAFRKEVFETIGGFKEWLGPGSIGSNAEEAEFALRLLLQGYKILYNPKVVVYHNKWLTKEEFRKQWLSYCCGEVACYGYFAFQGLNLGRKVVRDNFQDSWWEFRKAIKHLMLFKKGSFKLLLHAGEKLFFWLRGLLVAWYFARKDS